MTFDLLEEQLGGYRGSKEYLKILELAAKDSEVRVDAALLVLLGAGDEPISDQGIEAMLGAEHHTTVRDVEVAAVDLRVFDQLLQCAGGAAMSAAPQIRTALLENLKELHLPAMRECFEQAAQQAEKETLSYEQYLLQLTERECESRRRNRIAMLLRESGCHGRRRWPTST
jgi:hypothetical protein